MRYLDFICPHCKQSLEASEDSFGQVLDCPSCNKKIRVPKSQMCPKSALEPVHDAIFKAISHAAHQNVNVEIEREASPMGIAALVLGILSCLTCWIPFIGLLSIPLSLIGLLIGVIGIIMAIVSKNTGFAFPIGGGIVCIVAIFVAVLSTEGCVKAASDVSERAQKTNVQSIVSSKPSVTTPYKFEPGPPQPTEQWISATNVIRQEHVQVRITSVNVRRVGVKDMFGDLHLSKEAHLVIKIEIANLSMGKKIDFSTWRGGYFNFGFDKDFASLTDDNDNTYRRINFGVSTVPVHSVDRESIYPREFIEDVLVYEVPVDAAKWLRIELPASNFNGDGTLRFQIPASMIKKYLDN